MISCRRCVNIRRRVSIRCFRNGPSPTTDCVQGDHEEAGHAGRHVRAQPREVQEARPHGLQEGRAYAFVLMWHTRSSSCASTPERGTRRSASRRSATWTPGSGRSTSSTSRKRPLVAFHAGSPHRGSPSDLHRLSPATPEVVGGQYSGFTSALPSKNPMTGSCTILS